MSERFATHALALAAFMLCWPGGLAQPARAGHALQPQAPGFALDPIGDANPWSTATLEEALKTSKKNHRFLMVFIYDDKPVSRRMLTRTWTNPTLAAWVMWHAELIKFDSRGAMGQRLMAAHGVGPDRLPATIVYLRGKSFRTFEHGGLALEPEERRRLVIEPIPAIAPDAPAPRSVPGLLLRLDMALESARLSDVPWGVLHDQKNREPDPPPPSDPRFGIDDGLGAVVADLLPEADGTPPDVLGRLEAAREAVRDGDLHRATGLYTWLWERGEAVDPGMAGVRLTIIAEEMVALAKKRPASADRFESIRSEASSRLLWAGHDGHDEWFILNAIAGRDLDSLLYLARFSVEEEEASMIPGDTLAAWRWMERRATAGAAGEAVSRDQPARWCEDRLKRLAPVAAAQSRPVRIPPEAWATLQAFRTRLLATECARVYAVALSAGEEALAERAASMALDAAGPSAARTQRILVATALAAGQARAAHAQWLGDTPPHDPLRLRLARPRPPAPPPPPPPPPHPSP